MSIAFERARKTFLGFLQARGKALNTIKNYACDLGDLAAFCEKYALDFQNLGLAQLEAFHADLKKRGLRPNSRRRKLMTAKTFLRYLSGRMDVSTVGSEKIVPPEKVEKPPKLVSRALVLGVARNQPDTGLGWRNRALVGVLLETGMLVSEALALRRQDCAFSKSGATLSIQGKRARVAQVGEATAAALREVIKRHGGGRKHFFYGYSRSGPNAERMTPRGVEVLFKGWARSLGQKHFHPRTLRHLFVVDCLLKGMSEAEVMKGLGLRTPYAFRIYRPLVEEGVRSTKAATYNADSAPAEEPARP
jgi:integrase/recombinase XerD